jgi:hypothetical protein
MKRQSKSRSEFATKLKISIRLFAAKTVMQMRSMQYQPEFPAPIHERAQQGNRIRPSRKPDSETHPRFQQRCVKRKCRR